MRHSTRHMAVVGPLDFRCTHVRYHFFNVITINIDGIDGKQARRLGLSSPLGELMDHCCDAWTAAFYPSILFSLFSGQVDSGVLFTCEWIIICGFLLAHWEKSITGVLYLPWSYDFGQMVCPKLIYLLHRHCAIFYYTSIIFYGFHCTVSVSVVVIHCFL